MILYEFEGKQLLFNAGILVPQSQLLNSSQEEIILKCPLVLKAQVLSGKRAQAGGIVIVEDNENLKKELTDLFNEVINKEKVEKVLAEEKIDYQSEFYLSISYDTDQRYPVLMISKQGGTGIESREVQTFKIDPLTEQLRTTQNTSQSDNQKFRNSDSLSISESFREIPTDLIQKLINLFFETDMLLLEINPLVQNSEGKWIALDAKIKLDDDAKGRHPDWKYSQRAALGRTPTKNEIEAKKIDAEDHRGTAGSAYFDLEGDIAVLSSGGGISLTAMDALIKLGGKPANFTEYSGNPPKEKVQKLTQIVLSKPDLHGLWVIGTVAANFTDIHETLSGLIEGLRISEEELDKKFSFPIVIRRGGPKEKEAFEMLKKVTDFNLILQGEETSIDASAKVMVEKANEFAERNKM